jgi:hypothetical protein
MYSSSNCSKRRTGHCTPLLQNPACSKMLETGNTGQVGKRHEEAKKHLIKEAWRKIVGNSFPREKSKRFCRIPKFYFRTSVPDSTLPSKTTPTQHSLGPTKP